VLAIASGTPPVLGVLPAPVRVVIWLWFLGALCVWAYRIYAKVAKPKPTEAESDTSFVTPSDDATPSFTKRLLGAPPALPPEPIREGSLVEAAIREELIAQGRLPAEDGPQSPAAGAGVAAPSATDTSTRSGLFAGAPATPRVAVASALAGIALPEALTPLSTLGVGEPGEHRAVFIATRADAALIGRQVGDELERLGYTLRSTSDTTLDARRGDALIVVALYPEPEATVVDGVRVFPTARVGDVVVEFTN
jgi:hypothetical protein